MDGVKSDEVKKLAEKHVECTEEVLSLIPESARFIRLAHADGTLCDVQYAERHFDDFTMYYFVNTYSGKERAVFETNGASAVRFNYDTGETEPFAFTSENGVLTADIELEPKGSLVLFVYNDDRAVSADAGKKGASPLGNKLYGDWKIAGA